MKNCLKVYVTVDLLLILEKMFFEEFRQVNIRVSREVAVKTKPGTDSTAESYDTQASRYDEKWKSYIENTHRKLLNQLNTHSSDRVLDLSAGTGYLAQLLNEKNYAFEEFVLNDLSPEMIGIAQNKVGTESRFSFTGYSAHQLGFRSNSFDRVISLNAFHNYPNQAAVIREIYRVLKPGGVFYLLDWNREGFFRMINYWIDKLTNEVIQPVSLVEAEGLLRSYNFDIQHKEAWTFNYWNLFLISGKKQLA